MTVKNPVNRTGIPLFLAAAYLGCLLWAAPHTVHHFFEHNAEKPSDCTVNAAAERSVAMAVEPVTVVPVAAIVLPAEVTAPAVAPLLARERPAPRASPRLPA